MTTLRAFEAVVHGSVQGVGFRYYTRSVASRLGLVGYVRNLADGSVQVVCEGSAAAVKELESWLRTGPPSARVSRVDMRATTPTGRFSSFNVEF